MSKSRRMMGRGVAVMLALGMAVVIDDGLAEEKSAKQARKVSVFDVIEMKRAELQEQGQSSFFSVGDTAMKCYSRAIVELLSFFGSLHNMDEENGGTKYILFGAQTGAGFEHASGRYSLESIAGMQDPPTPPDDVSAFMHVETASGSTGGYEENLDFYDVDLVMDEVKISVNKSVMSTAKTFIMLQRLSITSESGVSAVFIDGYTSDPDEKNISEIFQYRIYGPGESEEGTKPGPPSDANAAALRQLLADHGIIVHSELMERDDKGETQYYCLVGLDKAMLTKIAVKIRSKHLSKIMSDFDEEVRKYEEFKRAEAAEAAQDATGATKEQITD